MDHFPELFSLLCTDQEPAALAEASLDNTNLLVDFAHEQILS